MEASAAIRSQLEGLIRSQKLGVLSTHDGGQPYASLVAYAATEDLQQIAFTTATATRKFANLTADGRVAMLINDSINAVDDFHRAAAVTALGRAREVDSETASDLMALYLSAHPYLKEFAMSPTTALISITVRRYIMVKQFQKVIEIDIPDPVAPAP